MRGRLAWTVIPLVAVPNVSAARATGRFTETAGALLEGPALPLLSMAVAAIGVVLGGMALRRVSALHRAVVERLDDLGPARIKMTGIGGGHASLKQALEQLSGAQRELQADLDGRLRSLTRQMG
jgi:hypothetical protein